MTGLAPIPDIRSREWFAAAADGRLLVQRCEECQTLQWYPRALCLGCHSLRVSWEEVSGRGRLHTFTEVHRTPNAEFADETPYVLAIVELEEGPRMTSRVVGHEGLLRCDMPLRVVYPPADADGVVLPLFTTRDEA